MLLRCLFYLCLSLLIVLRDKLDDLRFATTFVGCC